MLGPAALVFETPVYPFPERKGFASSLEGYRPGDRLSVQRDKENSADPNALQLSDPADGTVLGFVSSFKAGKIAPLIDSGASAASTVQRVDGSNGDASLFALIFVWDAERVPDAEIHLSALAKDMRSLMHSHTYDPYPLNDTDKPFDVEARPGSAVVIPAVQVPQSAGLLAKIRSYLQL